MSAHIQQASMASGRSLVFMVIVALHAVAISALMAWRISEATSENPHGLVVSWPDRIKKQGELRTQYHHVIDIMPTLLEAAQVSAPTKNSDQEGLRSCRTRAAKELSRECGQRTPGASSPPTIPIAACWRWRRHRSALAVLPRRCCRPPSAL